MVACPQLAEREVVRAEVVDAGAEAGKVAASAGRVAVSKSRGRGRAGSSG
jgi:hypothetical protein